ncbi:phosphotransferase [Tumebacillus flagellatus]|uniref:Aminoglycoside phosphotransferase domain-containing protein n=1 Tax=Tumebacillus flagellatus TaxID=1157490 RepID=A0A074LN52_9BACL|nr:phosphotransferase [Tumebacillus flagellatus]KEO81273.1 hypothetical protein EL26_21585 [Tumebacillus flagellatus]
MQIQALRVEEHWGILVRSVQPHGPVFQVTAHDGVYCFKRGKHGLGRLGFDHHAIEWLAKNDFPATPRFLPTLTGKPWAMIDGEPWVLTPWTGRPLDAGSRREWLLAARQLAKFHRASHGMELPDEVERVAFSGKWLARFEERNKELRESLQSFTSPQNGFEAEVVEMSDELMGLATSSADLLHASAYTDLVHEIEHRATLVHGNVKAENFTVDDGGRVCLIDFDSFRLDVWVQDLSDFLSNALRSHGWSREFACELFDAYHAERPLETRETPVLLALLSYPYLPVKIIRKYHREGRSLEKTLRKWHRALHELNRQKVFVKEWASWLEKRVQ